jgi:hypothetical protein
MDRFGGVFNCSFLVSWGFSAESILRTDPLMWTLDKKALLGQMVGRALKGSRRHFHSAILIA